MTAEQVTVHVVTGGGSFGRHLFSDAALEAVEASQAFGKPVKLMWHAPTTSGTAAPTRWRPRGCGPPTSPATC